MIKTIFMLAALGGATARSLSTDQPSSTSLLRATVAGAGTSAFELAHERRLMSGSYGDTGGSPSVSHSGNYYSSDKTVDNRKSFEHHENNYHQTVNVHNYPPPGSEAPPASVVRREQAAAEREAGNGDDNGGDDGGDNGGDDGGDGGR